MNLKFLCTKRASFTRRESKKQGYRTSKSTRWNQKGRGRGTTEGVGVTGGGGRGVQLVF
jgi:hypothetical protein